MVLEVVHLQNEFAHIRRKGLKRVGEMFFIGCDLHKVFFLACVSSWDCACGAIIYTIFVPQIRLNNRREGLRKKNLGDCNLYIISF